MNIEEKQREDAFKNAAAGEHPSMVRFKFATGDVCALAYAYLLAIDYSMSGTITLEFSNRRVEIKGRRLDTLFGSLADQKVISVRQQSITDERPVTGECCVDFLKIGETS